MNHSIKTRFAPSPTGFLHIGSLRTALYNYLFAKHNKGKVILRIEDTDKKRFVKGATENLVDILSKINIKFDEGLVVRGKKVREEGSNKPYYQSKRLKIYKPYLKTLIDNKQAYYCFCSEERITRSREEQMARKEPAKYDGHCKKLPQVQIDNFIKGNRPFVLRLRVPENKIIEFTDLVYGKIKVKSDDIDDQVLLKSDGYPTYHLANVVDDYLMGITHVIRGEEWLPSTPKHVLLYQAFDWPLPLFAHLPLIVNKDKSKLSKRDGAVTVEEFLKQGYLPEAVINYISFLGWNPKDEREIFSLKELVAEFSFDKVNKASAVFDVNKLKWFNSCYIKKLSIENLSKKIKPFLKQKIKNELLEKILIIEQSRLETLSEIGECINYLFTIPDYDSNLIIFKKSDKAKTIMGLNRSSEVLEQVKEDDWTRENLLKLLQSLVKQYNLMPGDVFWPVRYALSGREKSPAPEELLWVLEKENSLKRIKLVLKILDGKII